MSAVRARQRPPEPASARSKAGPTACERPQLNGMPDPGCTQKRARKRERCATVGAATSVSRTRRRDCGARADRSSVWMFREPAVRRPELWLGRSAVVGDRGSSHDAHRNRRREEDRSANSLQRSRLTVSKPGRRNAAAYLEPFASDFSGRSQVAHAAHPVPSTEGTHLLRRGPNRTRLS